MDVTTEYSNTSNECIEVFHSDSSEIYVEYAVKNEELDEPEILIDFTPPNESESITRIIISESVHTITHSQACTDIEKLESVQDDYTTTTSTSAIQDSLPQISTDSGSEESTSTNPEVAVDEEQDRIHFKSQSLLIDALFPSSTEQCVHEYSTTSEANVGVIIREPLSAILTAVEPAATVRETLSTAAETKNALSPTAAIPALHAPPSSIPASHKPQPQQYIDLDECAQEVIQRLLSGERTIGSIHDPAMKLRFTRSKLDATLQTLVTANLVYFPKRGHVALSPSIPPCLLPPAAVSTTNPSTTADPTPIHTGTKRGLTQRDSNILPGNAPKKSKNLAGFSSSVDEFGDAHSTDTDSLGLVGGRGTGGKGGRGKGGQSNEAKTKTTGKKRKQVSFLGGKENVTYSAPEPAAAVHEELNLHTATHETCAIPTLDTMPKMNTSRRPAARNTTVMLAAKSVNPPTSLFPAPAAGRQKNLCWTQSKGADRIHPAKPHRTDSWSAPDELIYPHSDLRSAAFDCADDADEFEEELLAKHSSLGQHVRKYPAGHTVLIGDQSL